VEEEESSDPEEEVEESSDPEEEVEEKVSKLKKDPPTSSALRGRTVCAGCARFLLHAAEEGDAGRGSEAHSAGWLRRQEARRRECTACAGDMRAVRKGERPTMRRADKHRRFFLIVRERADEE